MRTTWLALLIGLLFGCADAMAPGPTDPPRYYAPGGAMPSNPNGPHCDSPLVVWEWYETAADGRILYGWFCGPPPWWTAPS